VLNDLGTTDPVIPAGEFEKVKDAILQAGSEFGARPELLHQALARALVRCVWAGWRQHMHGGEAQPDGEAWAIARGSCSVAIAKTYLWNKPQDGVTFAKNAAKSAGGRLGQVYTACGVTQQDKDESKKMVVRLAARIAFEQPGWALSRGQLVRKHIKRNEMSTRKQTEPAISSQTIVCLADGRWVAAGSLRPGDLLVSPGTKPVRVASVDAWPVPQDIFELSSTQNFQKWALQEVGIHYPARVTGNAEVLVLAQRPAMHRRDVKFEWQRAADVSGFVVNPGCWDGDVTGAQDRFWKVVVKSFRECGLPVPSRTEELEELLLAFLGYWLGDGSRTSAQIGCAGDDMRNGVLQFMDRLCQNCGGLEISKKQQIVCGKANDYFFLRLCFSFSGGHNVDPIFALLRNLGLSRNGQKVVPPSFLSILHSLPLRHKLFFLAGGVCADGFKCKRRIGFVQSLVSRKKPGSSSKWHCHIGIAEAFASVGAAAGLGGSAIWHANPYFGMMEVAYFGIYINEFSKVVGSILPRKAIQGASSCAVGTEKGPLRKRVGTTTALPPPPRQVPLLGSARKVFLEPVSAQSDEFLVIPRGEDGQALHMVTAGGLWVRLQNTSGELDPHRIQWASDVLQCLEEEFKTREARETEARETEAEQEARRKRRHKEEAATLVATSTSRKAAGLRVLGELRRVQPGGAEGRKTRYFPGLMMALASKAAAPFWCPRNQRWEDLHQAVTCLLKETRKPLTTASKQIGRLRGGLRVVSASLEKVLDDLAGRRGVGHVRAAAAVFRTFALQSGCSEIDILDFEVIKKGKKKPSSEAVLEEEVGLLKEALERWIQPGRKDFLNVARGTQERAQRVSLLLKRHFDATVELENALNGGLEEVLDKENKTGYETETVTPVPKYKAPKMFEGVAQTAGGLVYHITPFQTELASVSNNVQLLDTGDNAGKKVLQSKDIRSYFVRNE
jgi:hypothetical protein